MKFDQLHTIFKLCGSQSKDYWRKNNSANAAILTQKVPYRPQIEETFRDFPVAAVELMKTLLSIEPHCLLWIMTFSMLNPTCLRSIEFAKIPSNQRFGCKMEES
ncbi:hypothetical protein FXO38_11316 [Capsicum annuum]|nr:hypothetical protein FXO37_25330 [Capsicum annuum]KAF3662178.1 hypothetical protein FXO38_11316 [Capsicum annuum]